jgi:DNA-binding CsgD family transcriptional regulator/tetratricopeptide (TPR) repeat protein
LVPSSALGSDRDATLRGIVAALEREGERGRLTLGVDDAHLLDDGSAALVHMLATTGRASVVVTARSGEHVPDSIVALWKDGPATVIALQALARSEVEKIVASVLDGPVEGSTLHFLWEASDGNTLYLRELLRHGIESGALRRDRDLWRWHGPFRPSERLQDLVAARIGSLDESEWAALEIVAVGDPVPISCLRELGLDDVAERLERRGILASRRRARVEVNLAHPLIGEVVRARMPQLRLDQVRLDLARTLEATGDGSPNDEFRVVLWRADAGDHSQPDRLRAAARRAWTLWSPDVAERLARAALASGPDLEAAHLLGEALSDLGRTPEAIDVWEQAQDLDGPDRMRASLAMGHASAYRYHLNQPAEAQAILRRARERITDREALDVIDGALAMFGATDLSPDAPSGLATANNVAPSAALAAAVRQTTAGQIDTALETIDTALATADVWVQEFPTVILMLRMTREWARLFGGHVADADAQVVRHYTIALAERIDYPRVSWCFMRGVVAVMRGMPTTALAVLGEGVEVVGSDDRGWLRPMHAYWSMAAALKGDAAAAEHHEALAQRSNRAIDGLFAVDVQRARAWVRVARGELSAAIEESRAAAELAAELGQNTFEMLALYDIARFGRARDVADQLGACASRVDGDLAPALVAHAHALVADDGARLDAASARLESLGADLFAAEAAAAAARAHRQAGRKASAYASRARARSLITERCEGATSPALVDADGSADLTAREREVCELASNGLPSRAIAVRLGITTRTVDNLLGRVYTKLGVSGRRELVSLFGDHNEPE